MYVRTMIFDKIPSDAPNFVIDGIKYEFSSSAAVDTFKYKEFFVQVYDFLDPERPLSRGVKSGLTQR